MTNEENRFSWKAHVHSQRETEVLAQLIALKLRAGDVLALRGDLGAGKTTFARQLIRAIVCIDDLEVPSPTYALQQTYHADRFSIHHYDFYRLTHADEVLELGFEDELHDVVSLIEWPDRAEELLPDGYINVAIEECDGETLDERTITLSSIGSTAARIRRAQEIWRYLANWTTSNEQHICDLDISYLQGDASARSYAHLRIGELRWLLMDSPRQPDGPPIRDGKPYSTIAHLAEDIQPFIAIGAELAKCGFSTPETQHVDPDIGLAVIEDLGNAVFGNEIARGADIGTLYEAAVDVAIALRNAPVPNVASGSGCTHQIPHFDNEALHVEVELLLDWFVPHVLRETLDNAARRAFRDAWDPQFSRLQSCPGGWVLRDFHSPNLIHIPQRSGVRSVGLIDYQDALIGHPAYDLVSLLQDARLDVPASLETKLLDHYCRAAAAPQNDFDESEFRWAYALLGAQRNTKILGIFARLAERDGKPQYLRHIPRLSGYLLQDLAHPGLADIKAWYQSHLSSVMREER